ncbi:MAG TPA: hypothetical protein VGE93_17925, partial [Bryobacteraceae bacterium]
RQVGTQFGLDLIDGRQAGLQRRWHFAHQLVLGHTHWLGHATQRLFRHEPVLFLAQQQADGRLVLGRLDLRIDRGQVEVQLA